MVIDTSALLAILFAEPDADRFEAAIADDPVLLVSAATLLEAAIVVENRFGPAGGRELDLLLHATGADVVTVTAEQVAVARRAYRAYGKGNHPAGLNYGDCFSYALARTSGQPLLFKGSDFSASDIPAAAPTLG